MKYLLTFLSFSPLLLFAQPKIFAAQSELIGKTSPELIITDYLLNKPVDSSYQGKFKVLEFWATWCRPCLRAVPHLNKLQQQYRHSNIVFLSFTYQRPAETASTLKKIKFETIVVTDTTRTTQRNLRVEYEGTLPIPRTVLIDDLNRIVWYGSPEKLTPAILDRFLAKLPV